MKILFICKRNETYGFKTMTRRSAGLYNSTRFIVEALEARGFQAKIVEVIDNNCIDREVTEYKADLVILEALWVVPEKFDILKKLHPKVKWFVHMHSGIPFLALEGIACHWLVEYAMKGVRIIANSEDSFRAYRSFLGPNELIYLPNVYISRPAHHDLPDHGTISVACFGAVRPMKNHLVQAMAAIEFAKQKKRSLRFYINATRIETGGDPVLKNLRQLFESTPNTELIEQPWLEHEELLKLLATMDIGMQVSLTETFNVVTADYVTAGIPIVVSKAVAWASYWSKAKVEDINDIVRIMKRAYRNRSLVARNQRLLLSNSEFAQRLWLQFAEHEEKRIERERKK